VTYQPQREGGVIQGTVSAVGGGAAGGGDGVDRVGPRDDDGPQADSTCCASFPTDVRTITFSKPYYHSSTATRAVTPGTTFTIDVAALAGAAVG